MENETGKPGGSAVQEPSPPGWSAPPTPPNPSPVSPAYPPYTYGPPPGWYYSPPRRSRAGRIGIFLGLTVFILFLFTLLGLVLFFTVNVADWGTVGSMRTETQTVSLGTASSATVNVDMGVGNLNLSGSANDLMNATFEYNVDSWKPIVNSSMNGSVVNLGVRQPGSGVRANFGNARYNWDLRFQNNVPLDMRVGLGVGRGDLYLSGLTLTRLEVSNGVGDVRVDLTGVHPQNFNVIVKGGVGKTTLHLPSDIGVRVVAHKGLGTIHASNLMVSGDTYTNSAYGKSNTTINIDLNVGVGDIVLE